MKSVLIIGHRENSEERKDNLKYLLMYYDKLIQEEKLPFRILIVEQDVAEKTVLPKLQTRIDKIFIYNPQEYNRAWGFNMGLVNTKEDEKCIICCDNDIVMSKDTFTNALKAIRQDHYDIYYPYEWFYDLNIHGTQTFKRTLNTQFNNYCIMGERYGGTPSKNIFKYGGCFFIYRDFYFDLGGMDDRFEVWGGEDDEFAVRFQRVLEFRKKNWNPRSSEHSIFHLYHAPINIMEIRNNLKYRDNLKIIESSKNMKYDELLKHNVLLKTKINNPNRYKNT